MHRSTLEFVAQVPIGLDGYGLALVIGAPALLALASAIGLWLKKRP